MMCKLLALAITLDGALAVLYGDAYLKWLEERLPWPVPPIERWFQAWPDALLRGGAAIQALLGLWLIGRCSQRI